jgi:prepilin-type N-terminal cleavage/methylation domain-containing protein
MKIKKNLRNLGFTIYEVLAVIAIIGVIASITVPVVINNQKTYNKLVFEQKCMLYEKVFLEKYEKYQFAFYGSTPLTSNVKLRIPFITKIENEDNMFVDILDKTYVYYFIYETLFGSQFSYDKYKIDYAPAKILSTNAFYPSVYSLVLNDNIVIDYHLNIFVSSYNKTQLATIGKVVIKQNDLVYEFDV